MMFAQTLLQMENIKLKYFLFLAFQYDFLFSFISDDVFKNHNWVLNFIDVFDFLVVI